MIKIELPGYEEFEKVRIKLDKPRKVLLTGKFGNPNMFSYTPLELEKYNGKCGIYIILKDEKVDYVGSTQDLAHRFGTHKYLIKNP